MGINEIIFMQVRVVRLFCKRFALKAAAVNKIFIDNRIYDLIRDGYGSYHCGGDEIVYNDVFEVLRKNGVLV